MVRSPAIPSWTSSLATSTLPVNWSTPSPDTKATTIGRSAPAANAITLEAYTSNTATSTKQISSLASKSAISYTTLSYSNLAIISSPPQNISTYPTRPTIEGCQADLFGEVITLFAEITNSSNTAGAEISQLWLVFSESAKSLLRHVQSLSKVFLEASKTKSVYTTL